MEVSTDGGTTWLKLGELTNCSYEGTHEPREFTDKYSNANSEFGPGKKSSTMSGEGNTAFASEAGFVKPNDLEGYRDGRTNLSIRMSTGNAGDFQWSGSGYVTTFSLTAPNVGENMTYSIAFQLSGAVVNAAVS